MKILIVGSGPNWKESPFEDEGYEVWTYGLLADLLPRVDLVFEMHRRDQWVKFRGVDSDEAYVARLNKLGKRIYMQHVHEDIPNSAKYPLGMVMQIVGSQFYSTVAYQLGLAALEMVEEKNVEEVFLGGLDLCTYEEWADQRPNVNRLIGFLQGMGVKVNIPSSSLLLGKPYSYGYQVLTEDPRAVDALITEDLAQLGSLMSKMATHHFIRKEAELFTKENQSAESNHDSTGGESNGGSLPGGEYLGYGQGNGEVPPGGNVAGGTEEMGGCKVEW